MKDGTAGGEQHVGLCVYFGKVYRQSEDGSTRQDRAAGPPDRGQEEARGPEPKKGKIVYSAQG